MKLIGIVNYFSQYTKTDAQVYLNRAYVDYFKNFGRVVLIDPSEATVFEGLDLLVLPGGPDVNPIRYGQFPNKSSHRCYYEFPGTHFPGIDYGFSDSSIHDAGY